MWFSFPALNLTFYTYYFDYEAQARSVFFPPISQCPTTDTGSVPISKREEEEETALPARHHSRHLSHKKKHITPLTREQQAQHALESLPFILRKSLEAHRYHSAVSEEKSRLRQVYSCSSVNILPNFSWENGYDHSQFVAQNDPNFPSLNSTDPTRNDPNNPLISANEDK